LGNGGLRGQVSAGNLVGGEAAKQAQREGYSRFGREHRMAGDEYQPQQIVANIVIHGSSEVGDCIFTLGEFAAENLVLAVDQCPSAEVVDGAMFRRGHQPGARILGDARFRPLLKSGNQCVLCEFLGNPNVAYDSSQPGNYAGRLDSPNGFDSVMRLGSCHSYRSQHVHGFYATSARLRMPAQFCSAELGS